MTLTGISLREEIVRTCGESSLDNVSQTIDLDSIKILSVLGQGSFARVYLVSKTEKFDAVTNQPICDKCNGPCMCGKMSMTSTAESESGCGTFICE